MTAETTRRLYAALTLAGALLLGGCLENEDVNRGDNATFAVEEGRPFAEPSKLRSEGGALVATLTVGAGSLDVSGAEVLGKSYNGSFVGPTMVVSPGDSIRLRLENNLDEPTNIHFHGFHTSPSGIADNVLRTIPARTTAKVAVPVPRDMNPGLYWYHSHSHGISEEQVSSGLSGAIVVKGIEDRLPPDLKNVRQRLFALKDAQVRDGAIVTKSIDSGAPTTRTVNGLVDPVAEIAPGETQMWRLANIGADIWYRVYFDGMPFHVIGEDSNPVGEVWQTKELLLPPGKRYDVLVNGPRRGGYKLKTLAYSTGKQGDDYPERTLASVRSLGDPVAPVAMPRSLGSKPDFGAAKIDKRRRFTFSESANGLKFFINGKQFSHDRVDVRARLGDTEEWVIINKSGEMHPFHIHVNDFQVMSVNGKPYPAKSLQDTVPLPVGGRVVIRQRYTQFAGKFVFHCHILGHEDAGMMQVIEVSEPPRSG